MGKKNGSQELSPDAFQHKTDWKSYKGERKGAIDEVYLHLSYLLETSEENFSIGRKIYVI